MSDFGDPSSLYDRWGCPPAYLVKCELIFFIIKPFLLWYSLLPLMVFLSLFFQVSTLLLISPSSIPLLSIWNHSPNSVAFCSWISSLSSVSINSALILAPQSVSWTYILLDWILCLLYWFPSCPLCPPLLSYFCTV